MVALASRADSGWWGPQSKTCDDPVVIKAVYFDGDQTLWDFEVLMRRSLAATLTRLRTLRPGIRTEDLDVESVVADREAVVKELRGTEKNLERIRLAAFSRTLSRLGLQDDDLAAQLNAYYLEHRFDNVGLFPEVVEALTVLSRSYVLGLLSNGNGYPERSGLEGTFASVVFSQDHGVEKPDRRLFDVAAVDVGCEPDEVVMVGDSLPNDVRGAQNAGWRAIWLNRDGRDRPDRYTPDAEISNLMELPKALRALQALPTAPDAWP
jgi:FMN hydrolase / 5-amino-6-(5-phospho-D-ribitylamino)uracil phosphatase